MLTIHMGADRGRVELAGKITEGCGAKLVSMIRRLGDEGSYGLVELSLHSNGGSYLALMDVLRYVRFGSKSERPIVATYVPSGAGSAAAVLASLGDVRTASRWATLQYHHTRTGEVAEGVTADVAKRLHDGISGADEQIVEALADRAMETTEPTGRRAKVGEFRGPDWTVIGELLNRKSANRRTLLAGLRSKVGEAMASGDMKPLYAELCALDVPISAPLAVELRLLDRVGDPRDITEKPFEEESVAIPEWSTLYPGGRVPRSHLCRHALILGETGSGKTVSGVLPVISAMLDQGSPMGCMLVIDPKDELAAAVRRAAGPDVVVREIDLLTDRIDVMEGAHSIEDDLISSRVMTAANRILVRAGGFDVANPARTLVGESAGFSNDPYWADEGARLAQAIVAFTLLLFQRAGVIFGTMERGGALTTIEDLKSWVAIVLFGEKVGLVKRDPEIDQLAETCRNQAEGGKTVEEGKTVKDKFVAAIKRSHLYAESSGFRTDVNKLLARSDSAPLDEQLFYDRAKDRAKVTSYIQDFAVQVSLAAARSADRPSLEQSNLLSIAGEALQALFACHSATDDEDDRSDGPPAFAASGVASTLSTDVRFKSGEIGDLLDQISMWWNPLAVAQRQYLGVIGMARTVFTAFSDPRPRRALRFGFESGERSTIDFAKAVGAKSGEGRRTVFVYRVGRERQYELIARIIKAKFFEAVLADPHRRRDGADMPIACYVADEFHRFVTGAQDHGEQSYVDSCRSHGGCCVLATQSVASLRRGLTTSGGVSGQDADDATEILIANTATKMVFRSTQATVRTLVQQLSPGGPDRLATVDTRPPSTLSVGECYAALPDGRFVRKQLKPYEPRATKRVGPKRAAAKTGTEPQSDRTIGKKTGGLAGGER